jgi:hypothetical protein
MNLLQKIVIAIGNVFIVLLGIFPPWQFDVPYGDITKPSESVRKIGPWSTPWSDNGNLFNPPHFMIAAGQKGFIGNYIEHPTASTSIDWSRLLIVWIIVAVATSGALMLLKSTRRNS